LWVAVEGTSRRSQVLDILLHPSDKAIEFGNYQRRLHGLQGFAV
jgi:hypothetical protein